MVLNRETRSKSPTKALWTKVREPRNTPSPNPATHYAKRARTFVLALLQRVGVFGRYAPSLGAKRARTFVLALLTLLVGVTGFEPATSSSRTKRATKLRHTPWLTKAYPTKLQSRKLIRSQTRHTMPAPALTPRKHQPQPQSTPTHSPTANAPKQ